ncbi:MAG: glycosyltransferase family 9 protein, partial [Thermodesulfobacteriota bacterium]|nr:glycosyltransferase family 9 protein [Thermodesulfobacteriota bacterium]
TVGKALCLLVRLFKRCLDRRGEDTAVPRNPSKILIIRPGGMGDFLYLLPMVHELKRHFSGVVVHVLAEKRNRSVIELTDDIDSLFCYDSNPLGTLSALIRGGYDVLIDSEQYHHLSALLGYITRTGTRIGFRSNPSRNHLYTHLVDYSLEGQEASEFMRLLGPLGVAVSEVSFSPSLSSEKIEKIEPPGEFLDLRRRFDVVSVVAPRGRARYRRWASDRYGEVIRYLTRNPDMAVVIVGGKTESDIARRIMFHLPDSEGQVLSLVEKTSFLELSGILTRGDLFFGCDSGAAILAGLLRVTSVTLFGSTDERKWGIGGRTHVIVRKTMPCAPCYVLGKFKACRNIDCMEKITSRDAISAIQPLGF